MKPETLTFELNNTYFVIPELEIDVEFDYLSSEDRDLAIHELEQHIQRENITPRSGKSVIQPDDMIYIPSTRTIDYADMMFYYAGSC
ncbi:hypothetical protein [Lentibacillus sp. CBA3610]|uniref:hypothetical protein n=1 Tax=Lentibacillus sp. CBA3610 TaxID=2518176 RepID=UPI0015956F09|nr:hypothetical protein [Lentibacillus sp. CBA3610]QKY71384.1 hypothetical protein Len3610_19150 [Lentibacillus sp. CBA3610]